MLLTSCHVGNNYWWLALPTTTLGNAELKFHYGKTKNMKIHQPPPLCCCIQSPSIQNKPHEKETTLICLVINRNNSGGELEVVGASLAGEHMNLWTRWYGTLCVNIDLDYVVWLPNQPNASEKNERLRTSRPQTLPFSLLSTIPSLFMVHLTLWAVLNLVKITEWSHQRWNWITLQKKKRWNWISI